MNSDSQQHTEKGFLFNKKNRVSIWVAQYPYADIPDEYFEETFFKNNTRASNSWSKHYRIRYFEPENMETNGAHSGTIDLHQAAGECSCSSSFMSNLLSKAKQHEIHQVSWIILLFDCEYDPQKSGVTEDQYTTFIGAFHYDVMSDSLLGEN